MFAPPEPDTPLSELPQMTIDWPTDLDIGPIKALEPDEDIRFADLGEDPVFTPPQGPVIDLTDSLAVSFPQERALFPVQDEFLDRFQALSTIEAYDDGDGNVAQLTARAREDEELLQRMLRVYGYYDAQIVRSVVVVDPEDGAADADGDGTAEAPPKVRFDVIPGTRYRFGAIDLGQLDEAADDAELRAAFEIQPGDFLSSDKIVEEQFDLDAALGETGYPFAVIETPSLLIDHARIEGDLTMPVQPGGKYVFAGVTSDKPDFLSSEHLETIARFDPGDTYKRSLRHRDPARGYPAQRRPAGRGRTGCRPDRGGTAHDRRGNRLRFGRRLPGRGKLGASQFLPAGRHGGGARHRRHAGTAGRHQFPA